MAKNGRSNGQALITRPRLGQLVAYDVASHRAELWSLLERGAFGRGDVGRAIRAARAVLKSPETQDQLGAARVIPKAVEVQHEHAESFLRRTDPIREGRDVVVSVKPDLTQLTDAQLDQYEALTRLATPGMGPAASRAIAASVRESEADG